MPTATVSSPDAAVAVDRLMLLATDARDGAVDCQPNLWNGCVGTNCMADE